MPAPRRPGGRGRRGLAAGARRPRTPRPARRARPRPRPPTGRRGRRRPASRPCRSRVGRVVALPGERRPRAADGGAPRPGRARLGPAPMSARIAASVGGPGAGSAPGSPTSSGPDRAEQADHRPVTGGPAQLLHAGGQARRRARGRRWPAGPAGPPALSRPRPEVGASSPASVTVRSTAPRAGQRRADAGRGLHQPLEAVRRRAVVARRGRARRARRPAAGPTQVGAGAGVEEEGRLRAPGAFLQPDHELARCGRSPASAPSAGRRRAGTRGC